MSAIFLIARLNSLYLRNLIECLGQQYHRAANVAFLDNLAPRILTLRLRLGPEPTTQPVDFFLADERGLVSRGEIQDKSLAVRRIRLQRGLSALEFSVRAKGCGPDTGTSFPILAELDGIEISDVDLPSASQSIESTDRRHRL